MQHFFKQEFDYIGVIIFRLISTGNYWLFYFERGGDKVWAENDI